MHLPTTKIHLSHSKANDANARDKRITKTSISIFIFSIKNRTTKNAFYFFFYETIKTRMDKIEKIP